MGAAIATEIVFTALFIFVIASTSRRSMPAGFTGLTVGLMLTLIHLITIPIDNTSVNPVRSLSTAVFQGSWALSQLWVFILFPLVGGHYRRLRLEGTRPTRATTSRRPHGHRSVPSPNPSELIAHEMSSGTSRRLLLVVLALAVALAVADSSVVVLALPDLYQTFDVSIVAVSWTITAYNLAIVVGALAGAAGRTAGARPRARRCRARGVRGGVAVVRARATRSTC